MLGLNEKKCIRVQHYVNATVHSSINRWLLNITSGVATEGNGWVRTPHFCSDPSWDLRKSVEKCFIYRGVPFIYRGSHACILKLFTAHQQRKIVQTPTFIGLATPLNITIMWAQSSVFTSCVDNFTYVNLRCGPRMWTNSNILVHKRSMQFCYKALVSCVFCKLYCIRLLFCILYTYLYECIIMCSMARDYKLGSTKILTMHATEVDSRAFQHWSWWWRGLDDDDHWDMMTFWVGIAKWFSYC